MKTAVVILNYNGEKMLREYLPTLLKHTPEADIYVADNASSDGSIAMLREMFPQIHLIRLDKNYGFAGGYNQALLDLPYEYYMLLNSDVEVTAGWLATLEDFMESHPDVAACQPKLLSIHQRDSFEYAGASGGFLDKYGYPFCRGRIFSTVEKDRGQYDDSCEVMWATGAALMVRTSDWQKAEGFDSMFFAHNEEIDLCWRLRRMGRKIYVVPESVVYHVGGGTLPQGNPRKTYLNFRNNLLMLYKNLPSKDLRRVMAVRYFLDRIAALQALLVNRNLADFKAIFKARRDFQRMKYEIEDTKNENQEPLLWPSSILIQYYLKGHRCFSALS